MPLFPDAPIRVRASGCYQQRAVAGLAALTVEAEGIVLVPLDEALHAGPPQRIPLEAMLGYEAGAEPPSLTILLRGGERVAVAGDPRLDSVARDVLARARAVPEVTRALRSLGARRGGEGQEAFFAPFLEARRAAGAGGTAALDAFDAAALRRAVEGELARIAAARWPGRPAAARALEACLEDAVAPLYRALDELAGAAAVARDAGTSSVLAAWHGWRRALARVFECADGAWNAVRSELAAQVSTGSHGH